MKKLLITTTLVLLSSCTNEKIELKKAIEKKEIEIQKKCATRYSIKNSHGIFKVCTIKTYKFNKVGIASYYSSGRQTATTERFLKHNLTAAHPYLPIPCVAEVTLIENPLKKVIVKINDRGPFTADKRLIDLSWGAAHKLGIIKEGLAKVRVRVLEKESKSLKENGGKTVWKGEKPFYKAYKP